MCTAETVEIHKEIVPCFLLLVAMLERLKGQKGRAPSESCNDIFIFPKNVECGANVGLGKIVGEDLGRIVGSLLTFDNRTSALEELCLVSKRFNLVFLKLTYRATC